MKGTDRQGGTGIFCRLKHGVTEEDESTIVSTDPECKDHTGVSQSMLHVFKLLPVIRERGIMGN